MPRTEKLGQLGAYWLTQHHKSRVWCRTWYDAKTQQTRQASLGTTDLETAKLRLYQWYIGHEQSENQEPEDVLLSELFLSYFTREGINKSQPANINRRLQIWLDFWEDAALGDLYDWQRQEAFAEWMKGKGWSPSYQQRIINDGKAAINFSLKRNEIRHVPRVINIEGAGASRYDWIITHGQLGRLFNALDRDHHEHLFRYLIIRINTACRQDAALDLSSAQVYLQDHHSWLDLNPSGRQQTKKRRPRQPVSDTLTPWLEHWSDPDTLLCGPSKRYDAHEGMPFVNYHGRHIQSIKKAWRQLRDAAGLPKIAQPRTIRHTITTWLFDQDVPDRQIAKFLGHDQASVTDEARFTKTSHRYQHLKPSFCSDAKSAVESFVQEVQRHTKRDILEVSSHSRRTLSTRRISRPGFDPAFQRVMERETRLELATLSLEG